ncbi:hypothetical protein PWEIH_12640 [Listeria weihenstephanensis FSL R9-0317]|uniref:Uncharacterized protein n=1 Tax=Listeria weihenstephanensis TaxID=1006155 RepID=A0A1S7FTZ9_9LIST|nr:hypothetical protein UE46_07635 [Listeria weihenstephanensis]EUJ36328.1 hypothetical protein PWEIH_12640 [Listeria weihenstephanensis FSL R9-0317]
MDFSEAPKISRGWLPKLDLMKSRNSPLASTEFVRGRSESPLLTFAEATKIPRGWLLELDHMKSENSPLASTEFVRGRSESPLLTFTEATKIPRGWLLELDPKTLNINKHLNLRQRLYWTPKLQERT